MYLMASINRSKPVTTISSFFQHAIEGKTKLRLIGGRSDQEGRVEVMLPGSNGTWGLICGDGWSLLEGMVACRQLGMHYAQAALSTGIWVKVYIFLCNFFLFMHTRWIHIVNCITDIPIESVINFHHYKKIICSFYHLAWLSAPSRLFRRKYE